jgi:hypothetical protein
MFKTQQLMLKTLSKPDLNSDRQYLKTNQSGNNPAHNTV